MPREAAGWRLTIGSMRPLFALLVYFHLCKALALPPVDGHRSRDGENSLVGELLSENTERLLNSSELKFRQKKK